MPKLWLKTYMSNETIIVNIFDIKVEKNKTKAIRVINFKNINTSEKIIRDSILIHLKNNIPI